jgi:hypothetical protein
MFYFLLEVLPKNTSIKEVRVIKIIIVLVGKNLFIE